MDQHPILVFVGTYTEQISHVKGSRAEGIHVLRFDPSTGALTPLHVERGPVNPSFLAVDPVGRYLYAVNETGEIDGERSGAVSAYAIDRKSGALTLLNRQRTGSPGPCHLSVDATASLVLTANYGGGSISVLPIANDGRLEPVSEVVHHGSLFGPVGSRTPRAHTIVPDPANHFAVATDLGLDAVISYRIDRVRRRIEPRETPYRTTDGAGPRHLAFHPNGRYLYVINETDSTLSALAYDDGDVREIETLSTLPRDFTGTNSCADIHVAPSGRFVYGSNRGHDSIAIFGIDEASGRLTPLGHEPTRGRTPRNFGLDPSGSFLLVANQDSDTIVTFRIDAQTGGLAQTGHVTRVPSPVCVRFLT